MLDVVSPISIGGRMVGPGYPAFIVAEIGSNHCRDKQVVRKLIDAASESGFDAVKFQTYDPEQVFSGKITTRDVGYESLYGFRPWWEVARDHILMPREWFGELFSYARDRDLQVFSTAHSVEDVEFLMQFDPYVQSGIVGCQLSGVFASSGLLRQADSVVNGDALSRRDRSSRRSHYRIWK